MPKQTFKIQDFHGGLNSNADPRDIRPNESPSLQDVAIDSVGRLKVLGSADDGNIYHSGTAQAGASATITLASGASSADDKYNNFTIVLTGGTGSGQTNTITDYTGSTRVADVSSWSTNPDNTTTYEIRGDGNTTSILQNRGLFTMSSDRQLDGGVADETLIFLHDNANHTIDIKDSETGVNNGWDTAQINMGGATIPVYYNADGVVRVSDSTFTQTPQWFGYIDDQRFASLNSVGPAVGWFNALQSLVTPTLGKCLISTPMIAADAHGIFSDAAEYKGNVIDDATSADQVAAHTAVNLRVGVKLNEIIASGHADWDYNIDNYNNPSADSTDIYPCIGTAVTEIVPTGSAQTYGTIGVNGLSFTVGENECLIFSIFMTTTEYNKLSRVRVIVGSISWVFGAEDLKPNMWNLLVCSGDNISSGSEDFPISSDAPNLYLSVHDIGGGGAVDVTYYVSGIAIADAQTIDAFVPSTYQFYYTWLYDAKNKQESLPFKFDDVDRSSNFVLTGSIDVTGTNVNVPGTGTKYLTELKIGDEITVTGETRIIATVVDDTTATVTVAWGSDLADDTSPECNPIGEPDNVNSINVAGSPVLFNFDSYILPTTADGNTYSIGSRTSGARLYWKVEENDNYFLIGELDFIGKGFKWLPESDTNSYDMTNTTSTSGSPLGKMALVKGISPETVNTIDTFKTINGFSTEVNSLDVKFKTAVVHGRRTYVGNIKQDGKTHPDRILKSQVNRFDTFPEGMGVVDVAIRDGENIVKLEAYADRILQFKQHSLYVINVSENIDFLEDTYRNKGCAFDYHVTKTDIGIAWFNDHGVYLYDGKSVNDLLEKEGMRLINEDDWSTFIKDGTDDTDMSSAMIGYIPKKKQILIKNENNDVYIYDFVLRAWTTGIGRITESTAMTNFALDADQNLFYIDNTTTVRKTWQTSSQSSTGFEYRTPDIDFGEPGVRKKVYRVYVTYKSGATTNVQVDYDVNGGTTFPYDFANGTNFTTNELASASGWQVAELKPDNSTESNNIKSFQLRFATGSTVPSGFEVNDITIVYRMKNIR